MVNGATIGVRDEGSEPTLSLIAAPQPIQSAGPMITWVGRSNTRTTYKTSIYDTMMAVAAFIEIIIIIRVCEVACHIDMRLQMMTDTTDAIMSSIDN